MFNWLEKIRQKPMSKRRLIAFALSLSVTGILFVVWLSVWLPNAFNKGTIAAKNAQFETPTDNVMQSFSTAWAGITTQFSELQNAITNTNLSGSAEYKATSTTPTVQATTTQSTEMSTTSGLRF